MSVSGHGPRQRAKTENNKSDSFSKLFPAWIRDPLPSPTDTRGHHSLTEDGTVSQDLHRDPKSIL